MDPLDWGTRARPYLVVTVDEDPREGKERSFGDFNVLQYGPFFRFYGLVGRFNTLEPAFHAPRLIAVQLRVGDNPPQDWFMDLKRARAELKKIQRVQEWSIRLDQAHAERTGEVIYVPVKRAGNQCGWWSELMEARCQHNSNLTLVTTKTGLPIFFCPTHLASERRDQYARRISA
jgi:hypothetical protein